MRSIIILVSLLLSLFCFHIFVLSLPNYLAKTASNQLISPYTIVETVRSPILGNCVSSNGKPNTMAVITKCTTPYQNGVSLRILIILYCYFNYIFIPHHKKWVHFTPCRTYLQFPIIGVALVIFCHIPFPLS
jgi:hypothetical protein